MAADIRQSDNLNFTALATQTEGYSASDLQDLVSRAVHQVAMRLTKDPSAVVSDPHSFEDALYVSRYTRGSFPTKTLLQLKPTLSP